MPFTTAQRLPGTQDISMIVVKVADPEDVDASRRQIDAMLQAEVRRGAHRVHPGADARDPVDLLGMLTVMLAGIAGISLLVGGIGIMNIMLVSV